MMDWIFLDKKNYQFSIMQLRLIHFLFLAIGLRCSQATSGENTETKEIDRPSNNEDKNYIETPSSQEERPRVSSTEQKASSSSLNKKSKLNSVRNLKLTEDKKKISCNKNSDCSNEMMFCGSDGNCKYRSNEETENERDKKSMNRKSTSEDKKSKPTENIETGCRQNSDCKLGLEFCTSDGTCRREGQEMTSHVLKQENVPDNKLKDNNQFSRPITEPNNINSGRPTRAFNFLRLSRDFKENLKYGLKKIDYSQVNPVQVNAKKMKAALKAILNKEIEDFALKDFIVRSYEKINAKFTEMAIGALQRTFNSEFGTNSR